MGKYIRMLGYIEYVVSWLPSSYHSRLTCSQPPLLQNLNTVNLKAERAWYLFPIRVMLKSRDQGNYTI